MYACLYVLLVMGIQVFETLKAQEATKQQELKAKEAEFKAAAEKAAIVSVARPLGQTTASSTVSYTWASFLPICPCSYAAPREGPGVLLLAARLPAHPPARRVCPEPAASSRGCLLAALLD